MGPSSRVWVCTGAVTVGRLKESELKWWLDMDKMMGVTVPASAKGKTNLISQLMSTTTQLQQLN